MKIIFIMKNGKEVEAHFSVGQTILQVAEENNIPLFGNCEGFGVCGCCHVYVENADKFAGVMPEISDVENNALDNARNVKINSRLACQIKLNEKLDGLKVRLP